jgi:hypothetical protein
MPLFVAASVSYAGGRYANPPAGLVDVQQACAAGLEAAQKGDSAAAMENAQKGRKIALASYKELSTMPMEIGSSDMKKALAALDAGNLKDTIPLFEHCKTKLDEEVAYYKKEGKL